MSSRTRIGRLAAALVVCGLMTPLLAVQPRSDHPDLPLPDYDIRTLRRQAPASAPALLEMMRAASEARGRTSRLHPHTGALRSVDAPGLRMERRASGAAIRRLLAGHAERLGLEPGDLQSLHPARDYTSASTGLRHVLYRQSFAGVPVFDGVVALHLDRSGSVVRLTSSAARAPGRAGVPTLDGGQAAAIAAGHARGPSRRAGAASLTWFPVDGALRLAWHVTIEPAAAAQLYDVLVDADSGELLLRRNRIRYAEGSGRVIQSLATALTAPRLPDPYPSSESGCPPPSNHELRDLTAAFRDPATVLFNTGRLEGNNTIVLRGNTSTPAAAGSFDGSRWIFDFPFNSAGAAETSLFFALNFAHDFFYDLGFDEAAGNFQANNFGRGGVGGDSVRVVARAPGRNNATFQPAPEGSSPIISMFLWDGVGCWSEDVDGNGTPDIDGDYDLDIVIHEFHHGVSHRLNTAFTGNEADAIGEGGSDFFAYSVNGDTTLAEYSRPGGIRAVNAKTYGDWFCLLGFICEPHANGEIFANVLWDVRERLRGDLVRGSEAAAINESHQLYVDALKLSPPAPTMLDMRDAMLQADALRNPGSPRSENFCRLWESFAARGMGVAATDTTESGGFNEVGPDTSVPAGCAAPPPPPTVTLAVSSATATEAGTTPGIFTISRGEVRDTATTVTLSVGGTATKGTDYVAISTSATIPAGASSVDIVVTPIDDSVVENNETVTLSLRASSAYVVGSPSSGAVTIVSDDTAPDLVVSSLSAPATGGAGAELQVTDVTKNQGTAPAPESVTSFYLSANNSWDAGDTALGTRPVPALEAGASHTASTVLMLPGGLATDSYYVIARADGPAAISEISETNNTRSDLVRVGPDLQVSSLSAPSAAGQGSVVAVTETTKNNGGGGAAASVTRFYLSTNSSLGAGDEALESRPVAALAAGASSVATTNVTIPATLTTGTYYLIAAADDGSAVAETSESNNTRASVMRIGPDLQVSSLSVPSRLAGGTTVTVTDTTKNAGQAAAPASTTAFYLSKNATPDAGDHRLSPPRAVDTLAAGATSTASSTLTLPAVEAGVWYFIAVADDGGAVGETFETNNDRWAQVHLGPDLDVTTLTAPSTAASGATINVTTTVKNLGAETAPPSTLRFYLSANTALDASDVLLAGERAVGELGFNVSSGATTPVTLPAGVSGRFYIIAVADAPGVVAESSETNNTSSRVITINP